MNAVSIQQDYLAVTRKRRVYGAILLLLFVLVMVSGFNLADQRNAGSFANGIHQVFDFPAEVIGEAIEKAPELPGHLVAFFPALIETVNIAAAATLIGAILGLGFAFMATRGLAFYENAIPVVRRLLDILRAIPEIVIALILIFIMGGGPVPAMIAIALHTIGALGKLFSEVVENVDRRPIEGLSSVGASWTQRMWLGVLPQVMPNFLSYALLRFEVNIRASAILGFVGAGGIGYELRNSITWGQGRFDEAAAIFLLLFLTIVVVDQISSGARNRLIGGGQHV